MLDTQLSRYPAQKYENLSMQEIKSSMKLSFNWKLFFVVWGAALAGAIALLPYAITLQSAIFETIDPPMSSWLLILLSLVQSAVLLAFATGIGLLLARRVRLGLPIIERWLKKEPIGQSLRGILSLSIVGGILVGVIIVGLDLLIFGPVLNESGIAFPDSAGTPIWQGFLAALYGGITEEVLLRLFLMTLLVWIGALITGSKGELPAPAVLWVATILAAVLFGLGHLPATAALGVPLNGLVITRAILLNGVGGMFFGWLYFTRGLESAMLAHYSTDIMLLVLIPLMLLV